MEIPDGHPIIPYTFGSKPQTVIGPNGAANGIMVSFILDEGPDAKTIQFFVSVSSWLKFCIDNAATVQIEYPELRQKHFVEVEWLGRYAP